LHSQPKLKVALKLAKRIRPEQELEPKIHMQFQPKPNRSISGDCSSQTSKEWQNDIQFSGSFFTDGKVE
jgi:hypothetical protein